ncbi:MAG: hypothetical protein ACEPOZ_13530 [Marinifilaceae bacterium]
MKKYYLIGLIIILFSGCTQNDSEWEIINPKVLVPNIQVKRIRDAHNQIHQSVEVLFNDIENNTISLGSGSIYFDNQQLQLQYNGSGTPYYCLLEGIPMLEPGSIHTIRITLGKSKDFFCYIVIPNTTLEKLVLPVSHKVNTDLTVYWEGRDHAPKLLRLSGSNNSVHNSQSIVIPNDQQSLGQYTLPADLFLIPGTYFLNLISYSTGNVDPMLGGGSITAIWAVEGECTVVE